MGANQAQGLATTQINGHVLMRGNCLDRLREIPDGSIDLILTDPPYGMSYQSGHRAQAHRAIENDVTLEWLPAFVASCARVLRDDSAAYFFCSWHNVDVFKSALAKHFKIKNLLVWEKNDTSMGDLKGDFAPKVEFIFLCHKGRALIRGRRDPNIFKFSRTKNELHPTEKPVDLCEYLASKFSDAGQTVLDPFMGSGTTGVACARTGRKFIGIELDQDYYSIALARIYTA